MPTLSITCFSTFENVFLLLGQLLRGCGWEGGEMRRGLGWSNLRRNTAGGFALIGVGGGRGAGVKLFSFIDSNFILNQCHINTLLRFVEKEDFCFIRVPFLPAFTIFIIQKSRNTFII